MRESQEILSLLLHFRQMQADLMKDYKGDPDYTRGVGHGFDMIIDLVEIYVNDKLKESK